MRKIFFFALLMVSLQLVTYGMEDVWPAMLKKEAEDLIKSEEEPLFSDVPAKLLLLASAVGIPVGLMVGAFALAGAPHKVIIGVACLIGSITVTCARQEWVGARREGVLNSTIFMTHGASVAHASMVMMFCEESFSANVRATATGIAVSIGTIFAVVSPFVYIWIELQDYLFIALGAFILGMLALIPLAETQGHELQHFDEGQLPEDEVEGSAPPSRRQSSAASVLIEEASDMDESTEEEESSRHNTTLSSVLELSLLFGLVGLMVGASFTSFYVAMGYYMDELHDRSIFVKQLVVGTGTYVLLFIPLHSFGLSARLHGCLGITWSLTLQFLLPTFSLAIVNVCMAFPTSREGVLGIGLVQAFLCTMILSVAAVIASNISGREKPVKWISLGFVAGTLVPVKAINLLGYGHHGNRGAEAPLTHEEDRLLFFAIPAVIAMVTGLVYGVYHVRASRLLTTDDQTHFFNIGDLVRAYRKMGDDSKDDSKSEALEKGGAEELLPLAVASLTIFLYQVSSQFLTVLCPMLGAPDVALDSYTRLIVGDSLGVCLATLYNNIFGFMHVAKKRQRSQLALLSALGLAAVVACGFAGITIVTEASKGKVMPTAVSKILDASTAIFCAGSFMKFGLEALHPKTKNARFLGALVGLTVGLICYATVLHAYQVPPKIIATSHGHEDSHGHEAAHEDSHSHEAAHEDSHSHEAAHADIVHSSHSREAAHADSHSHEAAHADNHSHEAAHTDNHSHEAAHADNHSHEAADIANHSYDAAKADNHSHEAAHADNHSHEAAKADNHSHEAAHEDSHSYSELDRAISKVVRAVTYDTAHNDTVAAGVVHNESKSKAPSKSTVSSYRNAHVDQAGSHPSGANASAAGVQQAGAKAKTVRRGVQRMALSISAPGDALDTLK